MPEETDPSPARPPATRAARLCIPPVAVDVRASLALVGTLLKYLSAAALLPFALAIGYREPPWPFLAAFAIAVGSGFGLERLGRSRDGSVGGREAYLVVALTWLLAAAFGALPYVVEGGELGNPVDAYFESMSGFTTTGASVLVDFDELGRSLAMWRQFTQWLGGMGIIVLALAVLPRLRVGGRQLLEAELPGPEVEQLGVRIRQTARRLWALYIGLTAAQALVLSLFGWTGVDDRMNLYEAVAHAFTTLPTGGFSTQTRSLEGFAPATQWVVVVFMVLAGANFALLYRVFVRRRLSAAAHDDELRLYGAILALGSALLAVVLLTHDLAGGEAAVRHGVFQAVSIATTTGYASADFNTWTPVALMGIVLLMFVGGSAGSTGGSVKVVRHVLLGRMLRRELHRTVHPELVVPIGLNRTAVDERTLRAIVAFILLYVGIFVAGAGVIALDTALQGPDVRPIHVIAAAATTLGNVGPGLGVAGPMGSFAEFSDVAKLTMIGLMWLGRLEIVPVAVLLTRHYWRG